MPLDIHDTVVKFYLQEHSILEEQLRALRTDLRAVERDALAAVGVIWGFLALHPPIGKDQWSWWAPPLFTLFSVVRALTIRGHLRATDDYLRTLERTLATGDLPGFQTYFHKSPRHSLIGGVKAFWLGLFGCTSLVAVYKFFAF